MVLTLYGLYSNVCSAICSVLLLLRHGDDIYKMLPRTLVLAREVDSQWKCLKATADENTALTGRGP
jgi:hypothetical protein